MTDSELRERYIKARKAIISRDFARLNDMQRRAVMTTEGPLLLLAGAGSGKTTVLINRVANLLRYGRGSDCDEIPEGVGETELSLLEAAAADENHPMYEKARKLCAVEPCDPWRVIAITFTNKAANELKSRLEAMLGSCAQDIWAQTFHSACLRILRKYSDKLGYDHSFTVYDSSDSESVMKHVIRDLNLDEKAFPPRTVLGYVSRAKDECLSGQDFLTQAKAMGDVRRQRIGEAYCAYEKRLKSANAMDFDDLIFNTVRLLEHDEEARSYYQKRFRYVLIDEYQDTNNLQYRLATALTGDRQNICVVGDDDQSIYKFRGATIENILSFENSFKNARVIKLEQNYRSVGNILNAANAVISNNLERKGKELWTDRESGDKITVYVSQNESDEAHYVASRIMDSYSSGVNFRENAILYRMNAQSNKLEFALKRSGIPYRVVSGMRFFDRAEIKDIIAYLSVILQPDDELRLVRIINTPARGIGATTVEKAQTISKQNGISLYETVVRAGDFPGLGRNAVKLRQFGIMMEELRNAAKELPLDQLFDLVIEKTGYIRALSEKPSDENNARIENVQELKSNILGYIKETGDTGLAGFMDEVALYTDLDKIDSLEDCVVLMTMHAAKGLEFDHVYIVGVEEGMFPGTRCMGMPDEMEEERRLCYVGMTRARKALTLTCARQRMLFGKTTANSPSRFIDEIPEEYCIKKQAKQNYEFSGGGFSGTFGSAARTSSAPKREKSKLSGLAAPAPSPNKTDFKTGDSIIHHAFGEGVITKMDPVGGDCLIEIRFGEKTKRFMLRAAAQHMKKSENM